MSTTTATQGNYELWLPTGRATERLGRSKGQLIAAVNSGLLTPGVHFLRGRTPKSPITWCIDRIEARYRELSPMPAPTTRKEEPTQ